jgi:lysophospholipase L1-like esterase
MHKIIEEMLQRFRSGKHNRILGFGSSNTERYLPGMHWFDCFDLAIKQKYGRVHTCINTGFSGNTSRDLLRRFEEEAAFYRPHLVFITIGGNDANPEKEISAAEFEANLNCLFERFSALGSKVIFQTYYAPDPGQVCAERLAIFYQYTDIVRKVSVATGAYLLDHLAHWEPFRQQYPEKYQPLMRDGFHVTMAGNMVMGVDIARHFFAELGLDHDPYWDEALEIQQLMDNLGK